MRFTEEEIIERLEYMKNEALKLLKEGEVSAYAGANGDKLMELDFDSIIAYLVQQNKTIEKLVERVDLLEILH